jgi:hypothetical protein
MGYKLRRTCGRSDGQMYHWLGHQHLHSQNQGMVSEFFCVSMYEEVQHHRW